MPKKQRLQSILDKAQDLLDQGRINDYWDLMSAHSDYAKLAGAVARQRGALAYVANARLERAARNNLGRGLTQNELTSIRKNIAQGDLDMRELNLINEGHIGVTGQNTVKYHGDAFEKAKLPQDTYAASHLQAVVGSYWSSVLGVPTRDARGKTLGDVIDHIDKAYNENPEKFMASLKALPGVAARGALRLFEFGGGWELTQPWGVGHDAFEDTKEIKIWDFDILEGMPAPRDSGRVKLEGKVRGLLKDLGARPENIDGAVDASLADLGLAAEGLGALAEFFSQRPARNYSRPLSSKPRQTPRPDAIKSAALFIDDLIMGRVMRSDAYNKTGHPANKAAKTLAGDYFKATYPGPASADRAGRLRRSPTSAGAWANSASARPEPAPDNPILDFAGLSPSQYGQSAIGKAFAVQSRTSRRQRAQDKIDAQARTREKNPAAPQSNAGLRPGTPAASPGVRKSLLDLTGGGKDLLGGGQTPLGGARIDLSKDIQPAGDGLKFDYSVIDGYIADRNRVERGLPALRSNNLLERGGSAPGGSKDGGETNRPSVENFRGGNLGSRGYTDRRGRYHSGTGVDGKSTGGVGLDKQGREVNAWGGFTRDVFGPENDAAGRSTRVICTELVRQGLMRPALQRIDIAFTLKHLSPVTVRGYHRWAVPYVRLMKRSAMATRLIEPFARWRAEEIAFLMGRRARPNYRGKAVRLVAEPLCRLIGGPGGRKSASTSVTKPF